jgi:oligosaccharyl transferase (archaeosortase A-associated)
VRRDVVLVLAIAVAAFGIRTYPAWDAVFNNAGVSFLETDAWYHVRLVENQVRNFPWRVTRDPYAAPGGQFVPIAPLYDTLTSTAVFLVHGRDASVAEVERVAALMPPIFGALTVIVVWALARHLFDRRAGLIAAALVTVLPGHFMDRTMLGFVDHHALEALLAMCVLLAFARGMSATSLSSAVPAGLALGLYLLAWGSGAYLIAIVGAWLALSVPLARSAEDLVRPARLTALASLVALSLVLAFQDPRMLRYGSQVFGLLGLAAAAGAISIVAVRPLALPPKRAVFGALAVIALVSAVAVVVFARDLVNEMVIDIGRLAPDPNRMGVLEARPLFLYSGQWSWSQPWLFFRTGFYIGVVALVPFGIRVWRRRSLAELMVLVFAVVTLISTIGQNRFGYYFVTACAVLGGWLAMELLDWAGVPHADNKHPVPRTRLPVARELAVVAVAGAMFAPNLSPGVLLAARTASYPIYWRNTMEWLRENTPAPFGEARGEDYYYARYPETGEITPEYTVMSWWDQGYWLVQQGRRVPVANPTQERAPNAAKFYTATDESRAREILRTERTRYVVSDFELPFRRIADGSIMGRFQTIVDWTGADHAHFYEIAYKREGNQWVPVWLFYEPYYRSMAFQLSVLGAAGATPVNQTTVVTLARRVDNNGLRFREIVTQRTYESYDAALRAKEDAGTDAVLVGLDPWQAAFPLEPLTSLVPVFTARTPEQQPAEAPWVRVFEVR